MNTKIGFIGQGWIGKHYADDFENRLYNVVRYALEAPYNQNKAAIKECDIVFIAVPTPTTEKGFSLAAVIASLECLSEGTIAVIKSTLLPGSTQQLQKDFPNLFVVHSPEFLAEATAAHDAAKPKRNLIGIPENTPEYQTIAKKIIAILPEAPHVQVMSAAEAELVKYAGNAFLYTKVVFMNVLYDMVAAKGCDWEAVRTAISADPRIGTSHTSPVHVSGHDTDKGKTVRGAGGHCFIKDFEALRQYHNDTKLEPLAQKVLAAIQEYNNHLLVKSGKDLDLLTGVHGAATIEKLKHGSDIL